MVFSGNISRNKRSLFAGPLGPQTWKYPLQRDIFYIFGTFRSIVSVCLKRSAERNKESSRVCSNATLESECNGDRESRANDGYLWAQRERAQRVGTAKERSEQLGKQFTARSDVWVSGSDTNNRAEYTFNRRSKAPTKQKICRCR